MNNNQKDALKREVFMSAEAGVDISKEGASHAVDFISNRYILVERSKVPEGLGNNIVTCTQAVEGYVPMTFARKSFGNLFKAAALLAQSDKEVGL